MIYVRKAKYLTGFKVRITFNDGAVKVVDLKPHLDGEVFRPLKNVDYFKALRVNSDLDTVVWPNGADFSPEFLYRVGRKVIDTPRRASSARS